MSVYVYLCRKIDGNPLTCVLVLCSCSMFLLGTFGPSTTSPNNYFYQNGGVYDQSPHPTYHTTKVPVHYGADIPAYPNYLSSTYPATSNSLDYGNGAQQPSSFFGKVRPIDVYDFSNPSFISIFTIQDIKSILPYAGAALLGIAAALAVNPRLLSRISGHVDNSLYNNGYNGYNDMTKYNYYGGSGGGGGSGSGYGHGYAAHHHGRKRREAERKFGQKTAYRHHTKRN
jgi:hypothetical protein